MYVLHILLLTIPYLRFCSGNYEYVCPKGLGWRIRGKALCANTTTYSCLHDGNKDTYREICRQKTNSLAPGKKFVIRGNLDGEVCNDSRYQPFIFKTNESKECAIEKSYCYEEGQIDYSNGSNTGDKSCRCDYLKSYAPITKTKKSCYCTPSEEDCSCYLKHCPDKTHLSSEYKCVSGYTLSHKNDCRKITLSRSSVSNTTSTITPIEETEKNTIERDGVMWIVIIIILAISGLLITAFLIFPVSVLAPINKIEKDETFNRGTEIRAPTNVIEEDETVNRGTKIRVEAPKNVIEKDETFNRGTEIRGIHSRHIAEWEKADKKFFETKATLKISERLYRDRCVIVVGGPGMGKSTIIRHIALQMKSQKDYEIIPIVLSAGNITEFIKKNQKQIFIVDDLCGKENINAQSVDDWSSIIDKIHAWIDPVTNSESQNLVYSEVKFLFATGLKIYRDSLFQKFEPLKKFVCELSDWPLTNDDKMKMIKTYLVPKVSPEQTQKLKSDKEYFPLLCKISENREIREIKKIFKNLDAFIEEDLLALKEKDTIKFCIITLCALLNNMLKEELLNGVDETNIEKLALENICYEVTSETNTESVKCQIKTQLEDLNGMYVTKTENYYHFIHAKVYHIAVLVCGQLYLDNFIKFVRSSFIAERFCFQSDKSDKKVAALVIENQDAKIVIENKDAKTKYFNRLMFDLKQGNTYSTFHNSQLQSDSYRKSFCSHFEQQKPEFSLLLKQLSEQSETNYEDYIDFKRQHHFYAHNMRKPLIASAWEGYDDITTLLLNSECNINEADKFGRTALFVACLLGNTKVVKVLLDNNADHSFCDEKEQSPLLVACKKGNTDIVEALLSKNADIHKCDLKGNSPFLVASYGSSLSTVQILSRIPGKAADFSKQNDMGQTAILVASMNGRKDVVKYLLQNHSKGISILDKKGRSPLFIACREGHYNVVQQLLQKNADPLQIDSRKRSPLFIACREGHHDIVKLLLANDADVFQSDVKKRSPLFIASAEGYADIVNSLLEKKAEINQCDVKGMRPLSIAIHNGHTQTANMLVFWSADLNVTDHKKRTPLYAACRRGILEIVEMLHKHNASITLCNNTGGSPLLIACRHSHFDVVRYLIRNRCNISSSNSNGTTPLLVAVENGNIDIVKFLIGHNADINQPDLCKMTPLHASVIGGHYDIVKFLIDKGADKTVIDDDYKTPLNLATKFNYTLIENLLKSNN